MFVQVYYSIVIQYALGAHIHLGEYLGVNYLESVHHLLLLLALQVL